MSIIKTENVVAYQKSVKRSFLFRLFLMAKLPMNAIAGIKLCDINETTCRVSVPYKFLNKNPFNTTFWAVLGMAAELPTGMLVLMYANKLTPSLSTFVTGCSAKFVKTAKGMTYFECKDGLFVKEQIIKAVETKEAVQIPLTCTGYDKDNNVICEFTFEWSVKARKS